MRRLCVVRTANRWVKDERSIARTQVLGSAHEGIRRLFPPGGRAPCWVGLAGLRSRREWLRGRLGPLTSLDPELEGTMTVAPASAVPGEEVTLEFPADSQRGIAFSLAQWSDGQWDERYYLPVRASGG